MSPIWTLSFRLGIGREVASQIIIGVSFGLVSMHSKVIFRPSMIYHFNFRRFDPGACRTVALP